MSRIRYPYAPFHRRNIQYHCSGQPSIRADKLSLNTVVIVTLSVCGIESSNSTSNWLPSPVRVPYAGTIGRSYFSASWAATRDVRACRPKNGIRAPSGYFSSNRIAMKPPWRICLTSALVPICPVASIGLPPASIPAYKRRS